MSESVTQKKAPVAVVQEDHLTLEVRKMVNDSKEKKIAYLRRRLGAKVAKDRPLGIFISNERLDQALQELRTMFLLAADGITGLGLAIWGPQGVGKSMLIRTLIHDLEEEGLCQGHDIVWMDIRSTSGEKRLLKAILRELRVDFSRRDDTDTLLDSVVKALEDKKVKILALDEIHNILAGETLAQETLNLIKFLWNNTSTAIVLLGTDRMAELMEKDADHEMRGRFIMFELIRWTSSDDATYLEFLRSVEERIPLPEPSKLYSKRKATMIFERSGGVPRGSLHIVREAAIEAIAVDAKNISDDHIQSVLKRYQLTSDSGKSAGGTR
jgi:type II secretory pathway predicted ATPase ExeA